jgi:hypothetical protein
MRIKIIGENNCARATRHLLRLAGFAVTDFLPAEAVTTGPAAGYAITIDLSPAANTPNACLGPDCATQEQQPSDNEEADRVIRDASSLAFAEPATGSAAFGETAMGSTAFADGMAGKGVFAETSARETGVAAKVVGGHLGLIHFDSVDSALEAAVLRHVTQLAAGAVVVDRPGGVVHTERELRIVAPNSGDAVADEAAAVAIEFGVLRGLLDLVSPDLRARTRWNGTGKSLLRGDEDGENWESKRTAKRKLWPFGIVLLAGALGVLRGSSAAAPGELSGVGFSLRGVNASQAERYGMKDAALAGELVGVVMEGHRLKPMPRKPAAVTGGLLGIRLDNLRAEDDRLKPVLLAAAEPQGQFATGQGFKITDGTNFLVLDPCKAGAKLYASINQTGNAQLVAGTVSKRIYVCSIHVVAAAATNVAVVEGTGTVCGTGTAGVSGFGGATAATGWNFAGNGGIAMGNGDSSLGAEGTSGDNLCIFNSGSGQVSGGISYVVE